MISVAFSQQAQFLDDILTTDELSWSKAVTLVFVATDRISDSMNNEQAWSMFESNPWYNEYTMPMQDQAITVAGYSYLLARAMQIKGGIFYTLCPNPRYAYRELVDDGVVSTTDPSLPVSGPEALYILQNAMSVYSSYFDGGNN